MDFPGVTLVLQAGLPTSSEQYVHRLGRTARAGAGGEGVLVLSADEARAWANEKGVRELQIRTASPAEVVIPEALVRTLQEKAKGVDTDTKAQAYRAWMGYYNSSTRALGWSKEELVRQAENFAREVCGWEERDAPPVDPRMVGKMGLRGVRGLNVVVVERERRGVEGQRQNERVRARA